MHAISTIVLLVSILVPAAKQDDRIETVKVLVWDERQPKQKQMYKDFLGNHIADYLKGRDGLSIRSVGMDDPNQGLSDKLLDDCDVLIWWGHVRQGEISPDKAREIVVRIKTGRLSLIVLHSAHWSEPFIAAMHERAEQDALAKLDPADRARAKVEWVGNFKRQAPKPDAALTPAATYEKAPDGSTIIRITRPNCCFPHYKAHGKPSKVKTLMPEHPIAKGIPREFTVEQTEMYGEPFHVPKPDAVIFEETWADGYRFRAGMLWKL
jgi:trehalose utilization protein